jgi:hypothetical protein
MRIKKISNSYAIVDVSGFIITVFKTLSEAIEYLKEYSIG